jgi:uncharacterized protein (TIRG00374 family)
MRRSERPPWRAAGSRQGGLNTGRRARRLSRYLLNVVLLGLAIHLLLPQIGPLENSLRVARSLSPLLLLLAVTLEAASYLGNGYLLHRCVGLFGEHLSIRRGVVITLGAAAVGLVAGGTIGNSAAIHRWVRGERVSREAAILTGWLPSLLNPILEILLGLCGLLYLLAAHRLSPGLRVGVAIGAAVLAGILSALAWAARRPDRIQMLLHRLGGWGARLRGRTFDVARLDRSLDRIAGAWRVLGAGGWRGPVMGAVANVGCDLLAFYLVFRAVDYHPSPGVLLAGYGVPLMLGKFTILPGGLGIVEGSMAGMFGSLGTPSDVTVVVILVYRLLSLWIPLALGVLVALYLERGVRGG